MKPTQKNIHFPDYTIQFVGTIDLLLKNLNKNPKFKQAMFKRYFTPQASATIQNNLKLEIELNSDFDKVRYRITGQEIEEPPLEVNLVHEPDTEEPQRLRNGFFVNDTFYELSNFLRY